MGRAKKYHTEAERKAAQRNNVAKYYSTNKDYKNKNDLLRYYKKKVDDLLILASASLQASASNDFQLTAFSYVNSPTDELCKINTSSVVVDDSIFPNNNITMSYCNAADINTTKRIGSYAKSDWSLDVGGGNIEIISNFNTSIHDAAGNIPLDGHFPITGSEIKTL